MKFKCGSTLSKQEKAYKKRDRLRNWHRVFAWFPIEVAPGDCRWLEMVDRKCPSAWFGRSYTVYEEWNHGDTVYRGLYTYSA